MKYCYTIDAAPYTLDRCLATMTLEDWRDKLLVGMTALLIPGIVFIVVTTINSASKSYVDEHIAKAMLNTPYTQDRNYITKSLQDLYTISGKIGADIDRFREGGVQEREKIWRELSLIRIELERIRVQTGRYLEGTQKMPE